jgi:hypothetical protein
MLWVYARVPDQAGIRTSRDRIRGYLFGVRIFQHDLGVVGRLQLQILAETFRYFRCSLVPLVVMLGPLVLILIQLNLFFGLQPLPRDGTTLLKLRLAEGGSLGHVELLLDEGLAAETPAIRVPRENMVLWRLRVLEPGRHLVRIKVGGETLEKEIVAGGQWGEVSPLRTSGWFELMFFSGEPPVPAASAFRSIEVGYAALPISVFGLEADWFILFLVVSVCSAFAFKGLFGVAL